MSKLLSIRNNMSIKLSIKSNYYYYIIIFYYYLLNFSIFSYNIYLPRWSLYFYFFINLHI